jgi:hypothetical protein
MSLRNSITHFQHQTGITLVDDWGKITDDVALARHILERLNAHFHQTYDGNVVSTLNGDEYQYLPDFHKYWESHHPEIINAKIDRAQAKLAARALHEASIKYGENIFDVTLNTRGLTQKAIAQVRFFTANQDFREPPEDQFGKYLEDNTQFDARAIESNPSGFLQFLGNSRLSQNDKRLDFARHAAEFLLERNIKAYQIAAYYDNDAKKIRAGILENIGMGYGRKKTDMFIRDMAVLGVWSNLSNMDVIDVASDRNTMKLALRTRILQTEIPLLSSFLDILGYQYGYIDEKSAAAWRAVWKEWKMIAPETAPSAPCMMDFLLYRIGREYCGDKLVEFVCENGHRFFHFGAKKKLCPQCRSTLTPIKRLIPCQAHTVQLPRDEDGLLLLDEENLFRTFDGVCIFESACRPKSDDFRKLSPPKAISIIGRTGWTDSYAFKDEGGGGMMG